MTRPTRSSDVAGETDDFGDGATSRKGLRGQRVCVTGRLAAMTQRELAALVRSCGGRFQHHPLRGGFLLVIGADGWPAKRDGSPSAKFEQARKLRAYGYPVEFLAEEDFFQRIGLTAPSAALGARHTISDLTRILGVTAAQLRRWLRMGLIRPVATVHRFCYFSFSEVASARRLCELVAGGASLARIRNGLEQFRAWLPAAEVTFSQLSMLERNGQLLLRLNGELVEPSGQRRFDLDRLAGAGPQALVVPHRREVDAAQLDDLFDRGLALEDRGHFDEAAEVYRRACELDPHDAAVHFNLGNVLHSLGRLDESIDEFREALRCDPQYAEAWNNLGHVLSQQRDLPGAVQALRRALELVPNYDDAARNLANALNELKPADLRVVF
ncbi:MAG TPA: tetratricopeptide repeat protein [Pirellulales bacterium]|nr:tetratricopeptide repeat protein [Pirellulales bacterium]